MRISDWSSDVCSSDLCRDRAPCGSPCARLRDRGASRNCCSRDRPLKPKGRTCRDYGTSRETLLAGERIRGNNLQPTMRKATAAAWRPESQEQVTDRKSVV